MTTVKTPVTDKNGKATHVHKRAANADGGTSRVAALGTPKALSETTVELFGRHNSIRINGDVMRKEFDYFNKRSRTGGRVQVRKDGNTKNYRVYTGRATEVMIPEQLVDFIKVTFEEEYYARMDRLRAEETVAREAQEAAEAALVERMRVRALELSGEDKDDFDTYIRIVTDKARDEGYENGRDEGFDDGYHNGYGNATDY